MTLKKIIVGADGSPASKRAVSWTAALAAESDAEVVVVTALDLDTQFVRDLPPTGISNWRDELRRHVKTDWVQPLVDAGVRHRTRVVETAPAKAIMDTAEKEHADLIVIGTHGHGNLRDRLIGSVSYRVVHLARHPVTVIPPDWQEPRAGA